MNSTELIYNYETKNDWNLKQVVQTENFNASELVFIQNLCRKISYCYGNWNILQYTKLGVLYDFSRINVYSDEKPKQLIW
jgi:hypothetical protein